MKSMEYKMESDLHFKRTKNLYHPYEILVIFLNIKLPDDRKSVKQLLKIWGFNFWVILPVYLKKKQ